jgi:RNA polymerase sigma-70 factor (ECF subfamily)
MALDDAELILGARKGDVQAFERLVQRYDRQVFAVAAQYVNSADDAKDIYQEVFLRVYNGLKSFRFRSEFGTWIYRITANVCLTHRSWRQKHRHDSIHESDDLDNPGSGRDLRDHSAVSSPEEMTMGAEISGKVESALGTLSPKQKLVFTLKHFEGYKLREIAVMMECTEGTVKRYLFTATQRMRQELRGLYES